MRKKTNKNNDFFEDGLYFVPLGGSEQFGVNLNVYICNGSMIAVDCGIGFADERFPGIDLLLPDPEFLERHRDRLKALIVTHAHEDHVGAVAYLWDRLDCPIYTTRFTAAVLTKKLQEQNVRKVPLHVVDMDKPYEIGPFQVTCLPVAHSVPDACSLQIDTPHGRMIHSGDWNLDPRPVIGKPTDPALFKRAGEGEGVLAYIGDSTNAQVPGRAGSERDVEEGLTQEFKTRNGRIIVTIFSSNIARIISILRAAAANNREVGVVGRSLHRMIGAAKECGYFKDMPDFLPEKGLDARQDNKTVIIMTGSQGESRSALARLSRGDHPALRLKKSDTVIFSARTIPGNEREINAVKNGLSAAGIKILTPDETKSVIHVSGHPCRDEIADMFQWLRPQLVIPVHGERMQLDAHAAFARECQVPQTIVPSNGSVIKLAPGRPQTVDHIPAGLLAIDQRRIVKADHVSIQDRRKLQFSGAVHLSLVMDKEGEIIAEPHFDLIGLIDPANKDEAHYTEDFKAEIMDIMEDMSWEERQDNHFVSEELRIGIRRFFVHMLGIKPKTTVHVTRV